MPWHDPTLFHNGCRATPWRDPAFLVGCGQKTIKYFLFPCNHLYFYR